MDRMLEKYPVLSETNIIANQKIEGTMINLFYDYYEYKRFSLHASGTAIK